MSSHLNPFRAEHADPWGDSPDVLSLNKSASDSVVNATKRVRSEAREAAPRSSIITILGPAGIGKTHLFQRLRRQCGAKAAFVLLRPDLAAPSTPRHVLMSVIDSLKHSPTNISDPQLDVLVGAFLTECDPLTGEWPQVLLEQYRAAPADEVERLVEAGVELLEDRLGGEISTDYLELLLRTPFMSRTDRRAALTWLSGREPSEPHLKRLGRTQPLSDADIVPALRTLSAVASFGAPIVLVFDQLENLIGPGDDTDKVIAHANLVAELFDSMRGMVVVQMGLDSEWRRRFRPVLSDAQLSRLERELIQLDLPDPEQKEELVRQWIARLPEEDRAHPYPFPFTEGQISTWLDTPGWTPRRLMLACRDVLDGTQSDASEVNAQVEPLASSSQSEELEQLWQAHLRVIRAELTDLAVAGQCLDGTRLMSGLLAAIGLLDGAQVKQRMSKDMAGASVDLTPHSLRVYALQQSHHRSVGAALKRMLIESQEATVLVLREWAQEFPPTWKSVNTDAANFLAAANSTLHWLSQDDLSQLLALHDLLRSARSQDVTGLNGEPIPSQEILGWASETLDWREWQVMRSLMTLLGLEVAALESETLPDSTPELGLDEPKSTGPVAPRTSHAPKTALEALNLLRFASVERLVREVRHGDSSITRTRILEELKGLAGEVHWLGQSLVTLSAVLPLARHTEEA
ncbi:MAG: hypothetical protein KC492_30905 [Myxococcales bacterium]|nr:hypothetical protein [Myxococcales bacterium]